MGNTSVLATPFPCQFIAFPNPLQLIPSSEAAIEFVPNPTATHTEPFQAIPRP